MARPQAGCRGSPASTLRGDHLGICNHALL
jgi:hypothetical protein